MNKLIKKLDLKPTQILVLGFLSVIIIGTILLCLPISTASGQASVSILDNFFTATSAVCVTGLVVTNSMIHWSIFGKVIILILIQIGGLGIMTLATVFMMILRRKIGLRERMVIQESMNQQDLEGMVKLVRNVIKGTFLIEGIGAVFFTIRFLFEYSFPKALWFGIFHSVSAFCNAGFDILSESSLSPYVHDWWINVVAMSLIIISGLGFTVWFDVLYTTKETMKKKFDFKHWFLKLRLHTKLVLVITTILLVVPAILFLLLEMNNPGTMGDFRFSQKVLASMFQSVTPRTAGFNTIPLENMTTGSKFLSIILMFIGGSPAGTAGGVKTVTIGLLLLTVYSEIRNNTDIVVFKRRIPTDQGRKALAIIMISFTVVSAVTIILSITEQFSFIEVLFEAVSAFGTVGITLGITGSLSVIGKIIICITMFIGRLGPMTIAVALAIGDKKKKPAVKEATERIMVG